MRRLREPVGAPVADRGWNHGSSARLAVGAAPTCGPDFNWNEKPVAMMGYR
jgi:hypothetical protein